MDSTQQFVITGTDTHVGKTVFAAALVDALHANYWKPIQAGLAPSTDSEVIANLGNIPASRILPERYRLPLAASPHLAAASQGVVIEPAALNPPINQKLVIEGAGGLLVPLTRDYLFADLFARWKIPVILCARTELGTINHTLLSLEAMRLRQIPIYGVAFIGHENIDTRQTIARLGKIRDLGRLPILNSLTHINLRAAFQAGFGAII